jgi:hypothetical protein
MSEYRDFGREDFSPIPKKEVDPVPNVRSPAENNNPTIVVDRAAYDRLVYQMNAGTGAGVIEAAYALRASVERLPADAQARAVTEDRPQNRHTGVQVEGDDTRTPLEWPERQPTSPPCPKRICKNCDTSWIMHDVMGCIKYEEAT